MGNIKKEQKTRIVTLGLVLFYFGEVASSMASTRCKSSTKESERKLSQKKRSCVRRTIGMREFSNFIEDMGLIDLQMENPTFTWYIGDNHEVASKINRI